MTALPSDLPSPAAPTAAASRRTFAIISHPDAGKTTLTEKLLFFAGAIHLAGHVKAHGERRRTQSDWMEIERARGISISSSVMTFERDGLTFNLLDTPGHQDFSEDTYRTLTAVDSAIMVIDAAKGIESQTRKLFEVCRLRDIPIITFINKIDREGLDPFALLDEIESTLALDVCPITWPVGMGTDFRGAYDLRENRFLKSESKPGAADGRTIPCSGIDDPQLDALVPERILASFRESAALALSAYPEFDLASYRGGHLTPVLFGSALKDCGVEELLRALGRIAPPPRPQPAEPRTVAPEEKAVTGFVFKMQANMDPNHRDRVAFMRLCSGRLKRGMKLRQVHSGKTITLQNPIFFFARERQLADEALPGDIIGIPNHGTLRVGDTLTEGEELRFTGIPNFAPEILRRVRLDDPMRAKQLKRALEDLAEEGVTQVFRPILGSQWIVGVVGQLQLEVLASRIATEYKIAMGFEMAPFEMARWVASDDPAVLKDFIERNRGSMAEDRDEAPVFLARDSWELNRTIRDWPKLRFLTTRERH
ncbi:MAG TPA: peptide chain release factor 3 [Hypericibacter adhaerens]|uniref:Peptide chain release factor 3 n=1 Tax=Hypericibacter adhaerens TaxID=2602016 RepID=A0A5J6MXL3_9PROT|nr:peptide chain release factor 3 [Hypericibacter adhaerens]QEX20960.1 peptide chain release factor 3 [Hypericibacter adhaerens]HWA44832.1 peptide chain release factor 3 [Hypericibacter adhaerens]